MPLDLKALVDSAIEDEEKKLTQALKVTKQRQRAVDREVGDQLLFLDYVETTIATDPALAPFSGVRDGLCQADILREGQIILREKDNSNPGNHTELDRRPSMLGLTPSQVLPSDEAIKELHHEIIPRVAMRIESDRDSLVKFVDPSGERNINHGSVNSITPLCDAIEGHLSRLSLEKSALSELEQKKEMLSLRLLQKFDDLLTRALLTLQESFPIIRKHQALDMRKHVATLKSLDLKAEVTHIKLMNKTYTPEKLKALMAIRHEIDKKRSELDKECEKYSSALRSYDSVEPEFARVVDEFKAVLEEINVHKFILDEYGIETYDE